MFISTKKVHESLEIGDTQLKVAAIYADEQRRMRVRLKIIAPSGVLLDGAVKLTDLTAFNQLSQEGQSVD